MTPFLSVVAPSKSSFWSSLTKKMSPCRQKGRSDVLVSTAFSPFVVEVLVSCSPLPCGGAELTVETFYIDACPGAAVSGRVVQLPSEAFGCGFEDGVLAGSCHCSRFPFVRVAGLKGRASLERFPIGLRAVDRQ